MVIALGCMGAAVFFTIQMLFCYKAKNIGLRCIPIYLILLGALYSVAIYTGFFGSYSAGSISGNQLSAMIFGVIVGIAFSGVLLAWIVYGIIRYLQSIKRN